MRLPFAILLIVFIGGTTVLCEAEVHSLIFWNNVPFAQRLSMLKSVTDTDNITVLKVVNITWDGHLPVERCYMQFYGTTYYKMLWNVGGKWVTEDMSQHKGTGSFTAAVVRDERPLYAEFADKGLVNANMYNLKKRLRQQFPGFSYLVHASETSAEAASDLWYLFRSDSAREYLQTQQVWDMVSVESVVHPCVRPWIAIVNATSAPLRPISAHEVVAAILRGEWRRHDHDPWHRYAQLSSVVMSPDLNNDNENMLRAMLTTERTVQLLASLPRDTQWWRTTTDSSLLGSVSVMRNESWEALSHCGALVSYVNSAAVQSPAGPHRIVLDSIRQEIDRGMHNDTALLLVAPSVVGPYTILDGNRRAMALWQSPSRPVTAMVGVSAAIPSAWPYWCW